MKKPAVVVLACLAVALAVASVSFVHRGYVGVMETGDSPRLLDHGLHIKPPFKRVTFYPIRSREIHLETIDEGVHGRIEFDVVLTLSVSRDQVILLHEAYGGAYVERLISPIVIEYFRIRGDGAGDWVDGIGSERVAKGLIKHLVSAASSYGVNVISATIRSYEVRLKDSE